MDLEQWLLRNDFAVIVPVLVGIHDFRTVEELLFVTEDQLEVLVPAMGTRMRLQRALNGTREPPTKVRLRGDTTPVPTPIPATRADQESTPPLATTTEPLDDTLSPGTQADDTPQPLLPSLEEEATEQPGQILACIPLLTDATGEKVILLSETLKHTQPLYCAINPKVWEVLQELLECGLLSGKVLSAVEDEDVTEFELELRATSELHRQWKQDSSWARKLASVMHHLSPLQEATSQGLLYAALKYEPDPSEDEAATNPKLQDLSEGRIAALAPVRLFRHQRRAVHWMLHRETGAAQRTIPEVVYAVRGRLCWEVLTNATHLLEGDTPTDPDISGGFLCDEMGLGKTHCVMSLVKLNPPPAKLVQVEGNPRAVRATLVVCPDHLLEQWQNELDKFQPGGIPLKVSVYSTAAKGQKIDLDADIVLTRFFDLKNELHFTPRSDYGQREVVAERISPLWVTWWRVVVDESTELRSSLNHAKLLYNLPATHRWCVTGTPMDMHPKELLGSLMFLRVPPFFNHRPETLWEKLCAQPTATDRIVELIQQLMWRTALADTNDPQLEKYLPEEFEHVLDFNNFEAEAYSSHEQHRGREGQKLFFAKKTTWTSQGLLRATAPLQNLRKACSAFVKPSGTVMVTQEDVFDAMIQQTKKDIAAANKKYLSAAVCADAAASDPEQAAIELVKAYGELRGTLDAGTLDGGRFLYGLRRRLEHHSVAGKYGDILADVKARVSEFEKDYVKRQQEQVEMEEALWRETNAKVQPCIESFLLGPMAWWRQLLKRAKAGGHTSIGFASEADLTAAKKTVQCFVEDLQQRRTEAFEVIRRKQSSPCSECNTAPCRSCWATRVRYQSLLYAVMPGAVQAEEHEESAVGIGLRNNVLGKFASPSLVALRGLANRARKTGVAVPPPSEVNHFCELLGTSFESTYGYFMAMVRLHKQQRSMKLLLSPGAAALDHEEAATASTEARSELRKLQSRLSFLEHRSSKQQDCMVCLECPKLVLVLPCAHSLCHTCLRGLEGTQRAPICPACKQPICAKEAFEVAQQPPGQPKGPVEDYLSVPIKGEWSTKIGAATKLLLHLLDRRRDPEPPRVLVFSHWPDVLRLVSASLMQNGIKNAYAGCKASVNKAVDQFRKEALPVLLLPLGPLVRGMNLPEAAVVIFLEPTLRVDLFRQAAGRVCRIGQERSTQVHVFRMRDSIEEAVWRLFQEKRRMQKPKMEPTHEEAIDPADLDVLYRAIVV
eukprot:TRINITY_DN3877_c0_g1_i5.p1 TRINITY_DN3877_c0_g1~~TRINITY_DN3877_c0_g1_i5.p1  ORF type:complete len:1233 (+),score=222.91 TRINITY_DN3877_c0_g1_i5:26-3724(+)